MAISKKFVEQVLALSTRGEKLAVAVQGLCLDAMRSAYSNSDNEKAQFLLDNVPQYMRAPIARWLRRMGIETIAPDTTHRNYIVQGVIDQKNQAKAFGRAEATPVFETEIREKKEPKKRELNGTPEIRATDYMAKMVGRLQESDYAAALIINDKWATAHYSRCMFTADGTKIELDNNELELIQNLLTQRRMLAAA